MSGSGFYKGEIMLGQEFWYFNSIKNYIIAMSHILDNIHVQRTDNNGIMVKDIKIPLSYTGKTKLFYKLQQDQDRNVSTILPRIGFMFERMERDAERSSLYSNTIKFISEDGVNEEFQYNPISYNFYFSASIWTKYTEDIFQMIEQISSFFDPDFCISVQEIPALGITKNISILLSSIDTQTDNEFDEDDRVVTADLEFVLKGYIYKPISNGKLIKHIKTNIIDDNNEAKTVLETIEHKWNKLTQEIDTTIIQG